MLNGFHVLTYSTDPAADRAFLRDVLGLPFVQHGADWLIFKLPPAELGVHPAGAEAVAVDDPPTTLYLMCDDLEATMAELTAKGVQFVGDAGEAGFGRMTGIRLPGGAVLGLYQPRHPVAYSLPG